MFVQQANKEKPELCQWGDLPVMILKRKADERPTDKSIEAMEADYPGAVFFEKDKEKVRSRR